VSHGDDPHTHAKGQGQRPVG